MDKQRKQKFLEIYNLLIPIIWIIVAMYSTNMSDELSSLVLVVSGLYFSLSLFLFICNKKENKIREKKANERQEHIEKYHREVVAELKLNSRRGDRVYIEYAKKNNPSNIGFVRMMTHRHNKNMENWT